MLDGLSLAREGIGFGPQHTAHFGFWPTTSLVDYGFTTLADRSLWTAELISAMVDTSTATVALMAQAEVSSFRTGESATMTAAATDSADVVSEAMWSATIEDEGDAS